MDQLPRNLPLAVVTTAAYFVSLIAPIRLMAQITMRRSAATVTHLALVSGGAPGFLLAGSSKESAAPTRCIREMRFSFDSPRPIVAFFCTATAEREISTSVIPSAEHRVSKIESQRTILLTRRRSRSWRTSCKSNGP